MNETNSVIDLNNQHLNNFENEIVKLNKEKLELLAKLQSKF